MLERQYCASAYTIDFENKKVLLMYNKKLNKWLQPGGHIEGKETPEETAIRETYEETGIKIKIINDENNKTMWFSIDSLEKENDISDEIKTKVKKLYENYR